MTSKVRSRRLTAQKCYVHFPTKLKFLCHVTAKFVTESKKNDYWSSSSNLSGCAKALCPFHSCMKVLHLAVDLFLGLRHFFITCNIASNSTEVLVLFTSLQNIVTLSITVTIHVSVKSTMSYNGTYDFCIFEIFLKNRFCGHSTFVQQTIKILIDLVWTDSTKSKLHVVFKPTQVHSETS